MPGNSSWMLCAPQGVSGLDDGGGVGVGEDKESIFTSKSVVPSI
jgi:hypothetical protein